MTNNKVVLFMPNTSWFGKRRWILFPHSELTLTTIFKNRCDFHIIDANIDNLSEDECLARIAELDPAVFLVSGISVEYASQYHRSFSLAKEANPECITVFGGVYPTILPQESMEDPNIDYIFVGPAEERGPTFIEHLLAGHREQAEAMDGIGSRTKSGEVVINPTDRNMRTVVEPDYSLIDIKKYLERQTNDYNFSFDGPTAVLLTSYGCKFNCVFCATRSIRGKTVTFRGVDSVLAEIDWLIREHGVHHLSFLDELFLADIERAKSIMNAFIDRDYGLTWKMPNVSAWHLTDEVLDLMKRSGCQMITVSVESGVQRVVSRIIRKPMKLSIFPSIIKKCREIGMGINANFVIGLPGETWDDIRQTFKFAEEMDFDISSFHIATPYPGTDLYKIARDGNMLPPDFDFRDPRYYGTSQGFITTDEFTPHELMILRSFEWDRINFNTLEKKEANARRMNMTVEQLDKHRRDTRMKIGVLHNR